MQTLLNDIMTFLQLSATADLTALSIFVVAFVSLVFLFKKLI